MRLNREVTIANKVEVEEKVGGGEELCNYRTKLDKISVNLQHLFTPTTSSFRVNTFN